MVLSISEDSLEYIAAYILSNHTLVLFKSCKLIKTFEKSLEWTIKD